MTGNHCQDQRLEDFHFLLGIYSFRSYLNLYLESILSGHNFIFVDIQFSWHHLLKRFFFSHCVFSVYLQLVMHAQALLFILSYPITYMSVFMLLSNLLTKNAMKGLSYFCLSYYSGSLRSLVISFRLLQFF